MKFAPWLVLIVPVVLWALFSLLTRDYRKKRILGLFAGGDNRLSLSRMQAFAWTMIIFGSYSAAMWEHPVKIGPQYKMLKSAYDDALAKQTKAATVAEKDAALAAVTKAKNELLPYGWVRIPAALLALAGISLASGVFASMIASDGEGPPRVNQISGKVTAAEDPLSLNPGSATPLGKYWLLIKGSRLGGDGDVRLDGRAVRRLFWEADGSAIAVDLDETPRYRSLTIDTRNGKTTFDLVQPALPTSLQIKGERQTYELADLVRDDANPRNLSLTKFQMFGWTIIAMVIYLVMFVRELSAPGALLNELPVVEPTVVMLTGISQLGYLGGKVASNNNAPPA